MIELLLQAERCLTTGLIDQAERLYLQAVQADARNSIAVVGLARVALERADDAEALRQARRALLIDPENVAAGRLAARLEEVLAMTPAPAPAPASIPALPAAPASASPSTPVEAARRAEAGPQRSLVGRLLRRKRP